MVSSYDAEVLPASVDEVGSQKSPSATDAIAIQFCQQPRRGVRLSSGLALTRYSGKGRLAATVRRGGDEDRHTPAVR